ncbi:unnamed protein product [Blepharisma stoltei]|uniref:Uncharacterized protein n=1 Tax=Blepharisma stoltei TaxID=1481888 RepID=A0AAU9JVM2_9CILI|nr:unnamed protein product [Blepharisma stoltei]
MGEVFCTIECFLGMLGCSLCCFAYNGRIQKAKAFIMFFWLILSYIFYNLSSSEIMLESAYMRTPENIDDYGYFLIDLYVYTLCLIIFLYFLWVIVSTRIIMKLEYLMLIAQAWFIIIANISAPYYEAWIAILVVFSPIILLAILVFLDISTMNRLLFRRTGFLFYMAYLTAIFWFVFSSLNLLYHLIFNTWRILNNFVSPLYYLSREGVPFICMIYFIKSMKFLIIFLNSGSYFVIKRPTNKEEFDKYVYREFVGLTLLALLCFSMWVLYILIINIFGEGSWVIREGYYCIAAVALSFPLQFPRDQPLPSPKECVIFNTVAFYLQICLTRIIYDRLGHLLINIYFF